MRKLTMEELNRISPDDFRKMDKTPVVIVLDNIRSQHNIGSVFRTADAFRLEAVYLCGITATPPSREIQKTALGATESVEWKYFDETTSALKELQSRGYELIAVEQTDSGISMEKYIPEKNKFFALVFGNEVNGVDEEALQFCSQSIEIPQVGTKHSLNVSVAAGIVIWHFFQVLKNI